MRVDVTADHIRRGQRGSIRCCPVALAVGEATGESVAVVADFAVRLTPGGGPSVRRTSTGWMEPGVPLPAAVNAFVEAFDKGEAVEPFAFDAEWPEGGRP